MDYIFKDESTLDFNEAFLSQKNNDLWKKIIYYVSKDETLENRFTPDVADIPSNPFDFTKKIHDDFKTFVQVYMQSHLTGSDNNKMNGMWMKAAKKVFGSTLDDTVVQSKGLFDGLFLDCSFQEQFMTEGLTGGCNLFQQSLTSNGLCFSFNTETPSNIWDDSFSLAKVMEEFGNIKPTKFFNFTGTGSKEGRFYDIVFSDDMLKIEIFQVLLQIFECG